MKKIVVIAPALLALVLSGCGLFHSSKPWQQARQENPLEIPPKMDRPDVSDALTIPRVNAQQSDDAGSSSANGGAQINSLHLDSGVDAAYKRVGLALGNGDIGSVISQSDVTHTYQVAMKPKLDVSSGKGFFARHFSNAQQAPQESGKAAAGESRPKGPMVTVQVSAAEAGGSTVTAQGDPQQVLHLMDALKARLGGS